MQRLKERDWMAATGFKNKQLNKTDQELEKSHNISGKLYNEMIKMYT